MRVVIAGCGLVGFELALSLADAGADVSVIEDRPGQLDKLGSTFNGTVHHGRAYDVETLREAGIEYADVFVAVTASDNANLMATEVANKVFGVEKAIARLGDPSREQAYRALGIDYLAGAKLTSRILFQRIFEEDFSYHVTFPDGDVEIIEVTLGSGSVDSTVADIEVGDRFRVAAVRRAGATLIPTAEFVLAPGDLVVGAARAGVSSKLRHFLDDSGAT